MKKSFLFISILIIALMCTLSSCGHEHTWSEWEIVQKYTCTTDEVRTHYCTDKDCNEIETQTSRDAHGHNMIAATCSAPKHCSNCDLEEGNVISHTYTKGKCTMCGKWMKLNIVFPETPFRVTDDGDTFEFTKFTYRFSFNSNESFNLYIYYDGEMIETTKANSYSCIWVKVIDSDGYVISKLYSSLPSISAGEKIRDEECFLKSDLDPSKTYTVIVTPYH